MNNIFFTHKIKDYKGRKTTICGLFTESGQILKRRRLKIGISICSAKDQFSKRTGRLIAEGRAIKSPIFTIPVKKNTNIGETFITFANRLRNTQIL